MKTFYRGKQGNPWPTPREGRVGVGTIAAIVGVVCVVAAVALWWQSKSAPETDQDQLVDTVKRRDFQLVLTESGEIESSGNVEVRCEVEANNTAGTAILRIVPEGTHVKPGDFLVELDSSALEKEKIQQQIMVNTSEALMVQAGNVYETAIIAMKEYIDGTFIQEKEVIEGEIFVAEENLRRAQEYLEYSRQLTAKGYVTPLQLEADAFAVEKSKKELEAARTKLNVLVRYTREKMLKQLESDIATAKAKWGAERSSHALELRKLEDIDNQITKCLINAPSAGQVTYAHQRDWRGNTEGLIEEGAVMRERQVIIRLPDPSRMQVKIEINESIVDQVKIDMPASIRPVGRDDLTLPGLVTQVNEYSEPTSRWEGNIKNYAAFVTIENGDEALRSGMTAEVTVHCRAIPNVLQIPVQAVYAHGPDLAYCFVRRGEGWEQKEVTLGPTNDSYVIIEGGLEENQVVSLDPRRHLDDADLPSLSAEDLQQVVRRPPERQESTEASGQVGQASSEGAEASGEVEPSRSEVAESNGQAADRAAEAGSGQAASSAFQKLDANQDEVLTLDELPLAQRSGFSKADLNGDGFLSGAEYAALAKGARHDASTSNAPASTSGGGE